MIKIIIADDHSVVRAGIKQIISDSRDMNLAGEAANGGELLQLIEQIECDVVVLDISMPGRNGIELIKDIHKIKPKMPVLVLSMHSEDKYGIRVIKAGGTGYLNKDSAAEELLNAIEKVYNGQKYFSQGLMLKILDQLGDNSSIKPHEKLSDREYEVMILFASGKTVKEIGEILCLSIPTISTYRSRILQKMEMKNNADLMLYAVKNELVE